MKTADLKAEELTASQLDRWLAGKMPRRVLVVPFGGPIPSPYSKAGMDVDGEFFDADTDLYGPYPALRRSRDRLVDWHHVTFQGGSHFDPAGGVMKGAILGRIVHDEDPETVELDGVSYTGVWGDFWANAGEKRRALVAMLERRLVPLFASSQPVQAGIRKSKATGHIDVWPIQFHTITTSPQNTHAVMPALKAVIDAPDATEVSIAALRALAVDLSDLGDLHGTSLGQAGDQEAKAGRALDALEQAVAQLRDVVPTSKSGERVTTP